jgi:uncharacterized repeat protein (TIGR03803 family)
MTPCPPRFNILLKRRAAVRGEMAKRFFATITGAALLLSAVCSTVVSAQTLTTLYSFTGGSDGQCPLAGLTADANGIYGTTLLGSKSNLGTVFQLIPPPLFGGPWRERVLYGFTGSDGAHPHAGLIADATGALYGTTWLGGTAGYGTVFKLTPPAASGWTWWTETVLHNFTGSDGAEPLAGLIADAAGALYGTTRYGGASGRGTVFKLTPPAASGGSWTETVLHGFNGSDGDTPLAGLLADATGALYGTTEWGGPGGYGTVSA